MLLTHVTDHGQVSKSASRGAPKGVPTQGKDLYASKGDMLEKLGLIFYSMKRLIVLQLLDSV